MNKKVIAVMLSVVMCSLLMACGASTAKTESKAGETAAESTADAKEGQADSESTADSKEESTADQKAEETEIRVFIAASLNSVMEEIAASYNEVHPEVKITLNADSSGTLLTQIEEGAECDIFFSAAQKQMNALEEDGLVVEGTRKDVLNNQVVVLTGKDSGTKVTGLSDIAKAESIALADGSVPVGKYTRQAMVNAGLIEGAEDVSKITTQEIMDQLGVEINECGNVSKVRDAVKEGSCEVGTTYYSDIYGFEDQLQVLETVSYDLTGNVIYPICQVVNEEADQAEKDAAADFEAYILSDEAKEILNAYYFDTDLD